VDEDDILMTRLQELLATTEGPPPEFIELAKRMFTLRTVDAELAALIADSDVEEGAVAVRGGAETRMLTFESADLAIEIEVSGTGRFRRVLGQLVPAAAGTIEARQPSVERPRTVEVDERGWFVLDDVLPEPLSLTVRRSGARPVTTEWAGLA
jgi:hypothetical protein